MRTEEEIFIDFEDAPGQVIIIYTGGEDTGLRENNSLELFGFHGSGYAAVGEGLIKISSVRMRT